MQDYFNTIIAGLVGLILNVYWLYSQITRYILKFEFDLKISFFNMAISLFTLFLIIVFSFILIDGYKKFSLKIFLKEEPWVKALGLGLFFDFFIFVLSLLHEYGFLSREVGTPLIPIFLFTLLYQGYKRYQIGVVFLLLNIAFTSLFVIGTLSLIAY
jgi:hypothetical protein